MWILFNLHVKWNQKGTICTMEGEYYKGQVGGEIIKRNTVKIHWYIWMMVSLWNHAFLQWKHPGVNNLKNQYIFGSIIFTFSTLVFIFGFRGTKFEKDIPPTALVERDEKIPVLMCNRRLSWGLAESATVHAPGVNQLFSLVTLA